MSTVARKSTTALRWSWTLVLFWAVTLLMSTLPNILWQESTGQPATWLFWAKEILLATLLLLSLGWPALRPLRQYMIVFVVLFAAEQGFGWLAATSWWQGWFGGVDAPFTLSMLGTQIQRLCVALIVIAVLLAMKRRRDAIFLVKGDVRAKARPVRWLGIKGSDSWVRVGGLASLFIGLGLLAFLVPVAWPTLGALPRALPLLPAILVFAALNAFNEEMSYRASLLSTSENAIGSHQAVWMTAAFFGIGHYYGVPYGVIGVVMAGFLGWFLGKSMVETRGLFWAWTIHMIQDVLIFSFMAVGSVVAGGG